MNRGDATGIQRMNDNIKASADADVKLDAKSNSVSEPRTVEKQSGSSSGPTIPGELESSSSRSGAKDAVKDGLDVLKPNSIQEKSSDEGVPLSEPQVFANLDNVDLPKYVQDHSTTLTFPEKLMLMLMHAERLTAKSGKKPEDLPLGWSNEGQAFVIRNKVDLVSGWLPLFFRQAKFSSFTRKLYRWGFRQVNAAGDSVASSQQRNNSERSSFVYFGHEYFRRDDKSLMSSMRSTTAAGRRRERGEEGLMNGIDSCEAPNLFHLHSQQRRLLEQHLMSSLSNQSMLFRNAALADFGMQQPSIPFLQGAVARAEVQRQQMATQRLASFDSHQPTSSQYVAQLSQLFAHQAQPPPFNQQLLALQQTQSLQQMPNHPPDGDWQRQELIRNLYEILLRQLPARHSAQDDGAPRPPPPQP